MDKEEFLNFLNRSQEETEAAKIQEEKFIKKLSVELFNFIFEHFPECEPNRESISTKLKELCDNYSVIIIDKLDTAIYNQNKGLPYNHKSKAPKIQTREESEKELQDFIAELKGNKDVTKEDLDSLEEIHWEDYEVEIKHQQFHKGLHDKTKEILVEFYEESILELKGDYLRMLDDYTYLHAIHPFIDEVYGVLSLE